MCMSRSRRVGVGAGAGQLLNSHDEIVNPGAMRTVLPLAVVADAVDFVVEADSAAHGNIGLCNPKDKSVKKKKTSKNVSLSKLV